MIGILPSRPYLECPKLVKSQTQWVYQWMNRIRLIRIRFHHPHPSRLKRIVEPCIFENPTQRARLLEAVALVKASSEGCIVTSGSGVVGIQPIRSHHSCWVTSGNSRTIGCRSITSLWAFVAWSRVNATTLNYQCAVWSKVITPAGHYRHRSKCCSFSHCTCTGCWIPFSSKGWWDSKGS